MELASNPTSDQINSCLTTASQLCRLTGYCVCVLQCSMGECLASAMVNRSYSKQTWKECCAPLKKKKEIYIIYIYKSIIEVIYSHGIAVVVALIFSSCIRESIFSHLQVGENGEGDRCAWGRTYRPCAQEGAGKPAALAEFAPW